MADQSQVLTLERAGDAVSKRGGAISDSLYSLWQYQSYAFAAIGVLVLFYFWDSWPLKIVRSAAGYVWAGLKKMTGMGSTSSFQPLIQGVPRPVPPILRGQ